MIESEDSSDEELNEMRNNPKVMKLVEELYKREHPDVGREGKQVNWKPKRTPKTNKIKSPSDTTIYAPVLRQHVISPEARIARPSINVNDKLNLPSAIDQISSFVEQMQMRTERTPRQGLTEDNEENITRDKRQEMRSKGHGARSTVDELIVPVHEKTAEQMIIDAE